LPVDGAAPVRPKHQTAAGDSADRIDTGGWCFEREPIPLLCHLPFRLTLLRFCPNPAAHVFNLLHLSRELIAKPSKVFDGSQFEYGIGQSVAASCKVAKIRSVHRLPRYSRASVRTSLSGDTLKGPCTQILTASWRHRDIAGQATANSDSDSMSHMQRNRVLGEPIIYQAVMSSRTRTC
jgi:hypothetical protein